MQEETRSTTGSAGPSRARASAVGARRVRLFDAIEQVVAEHGLRGASWTRVARRAGVSRSALAARFESPQDCFLALLDWMLEQVTGRVAHAFEAELPWREAVLGALEGLLTFLDDEPAWTRVCLLESMAVPAPELQARARVLGRLAELVDKRARDELSLERRPPRAMAEATLSSVLGLLRRRLLAGEAPPFVASLDGLAEVIVAPYLGPSAAADVARRGRARAIKLLEEGPGKPVHRQVELPAVLQRPNAHRMRRCLRYLADNPESSNRAVGAGIGVAHAGQVSTLLDRLHRAGLLEKRCGRAGRPNAWRLSTSGVDAAQAMGEW